MIVGLFIFFLRVRIIIISSTMNKKSIEKYINKQDYNLLLFQRAVSIPQKIQHLIARTDGVSQQQLPLINQSSRKLEIALKNAIGALGKFTDVHKAPLATPLDHSLDIFQAISDNIETSVQKYREQSKNNSLPKARDVKGGKQESKRPQDRFKAIKPTKFEYHSHEKDLEYIRTDLSFTESRPLSDIVEYVKQESQLEKMIEELSLEAEIAVDLEHSQKSYEGFTSLIQISSRTKDYIVDVFPLWESISLLKKIMQNPAIIKVMHGADMDTKWLQRDFNVHIHNLFDTYRAARTLGLQRLSYAFLLTHYCTVTTDKTYQTADWRQRPLPQEMLHYARLDTHYLLEIFDRLRTDLSQKALSMGLNPNDVLTEVYSASHEVTLSEVQLYDFRRKECLVLLRKEFKQAQYTVFAEVFKILNEIAQQNDVSFDEIVTHRMEKQLIAKMKELLLIRPENTTIKIDRLISDLKSMEHHDYLKSHLVRIKEYLSSYFEERKKSKKEKKVEKAKVVYMEEEVKVEEVMEKRKVDFQISFKEYQNKAYENTNINPFSMLTFEPIATFVARKFGVSAKQDVQENEIVEEDIEQEMDEEVSNSQKEESNEQGVIQFKRINPNVTYVMEQAEPAPLKHKPRKKRKQEEYEKTLRQKTGNIYELLED